jgi:ElaB/YqjD/DUF883 family membrane-anchored ribosome-binding protein
MVNWAKAQRESGKLLKEIDADDIYDQLATIAAYLNQLTNAAGKSVSRQWGRARHLVADTAHDAEETMHDNLAASLIIAVGLGVAIGYLFGRRSE